MHQWFTRRSLTVGTKRKRTQKGKLHVRLYFWFDSHSSILHSFLSRIGNRWHTTTINMDCTTRKSHTTWQLKQGKALGSRGGEWAIILRTAPFIGLVQTFPSTGYSTVLKRRTANYGGGNQAGEVGRAPSEESRAHGRDMQ